VKSKVSSASQKARTRAGEIHFVVVVRQLERRHEEAFRRDGIAFDDGPETRRLEMPRRGEWRGGCETQRRLGESAFCFISQVFLKRATGGLLAGEEFRYT